MNVKSDLTVMMAARNSAATIKTAVLSTLQAINQDDKLIIYDDASSDETSTVVKNLSYDKRIILISSDTKVGVNIARNIILRECKTSYVAVMDSDDICFPWRFRFSFKKVHGLVGVFGTAIIFGRQLRPLMALPQYPLNLTAEETRLSLCLSNPLVHSTALLSRSHLDALGGYSDSISEDYDLWLRTVNSGGKMARLGIPLIGYRFHAKQLSQTQEFRRDYAHHPSLRNELAMLRSAVSSELQLEAGCSNLDDKIRRKLYASKPLLKLEHYGLPPILRSWKNKIK